MQLDKRAVWSLFVGLVLAAMAVVGVIHLLDQQPQAQAPFKMATVVVAGRDLAFGDEVSSLVLVEKEWPEDSVPHGGFAKVADVLGDGKESRIVLKPMVAGEPVLLNKITGFGAKPTMSTALPEGKRAFSVRVNDVSGVSGFLLPGDRVDVLLTRQLDPNDRLNQATDIILQNIVVRGVDQESAEDRDKPQVAKSVTLEVTPEDVQKLALAQQVGQLSLALRNVAATEQVRVKSVRLSDVVNEPTPEPRVVSATPVPPPSVIVRRGVEAESVMLGRGVATNIGAASSALRDAGSGAR